MLGQAEKSDQINRVIWVGAFQQRLRLPCSYSYGKVFADT